MRKVRAEMISGRQIREGAALAGVTTHCLARDTKLDLTMIARAEAVDGEPPIAMAQAAKIEGVLIRAGVEFIPENGGRDGGVLSYDPACRTDD